MPADSRIPKPAPLVPAAVVLADALRRSEPLARLRQRLQDSDARFAAIKPLLPAALAAHVKPGPVDDATWSLLAANAAVAAKLRQLLPRLEEALAHGGWPPRAIRVRIQAG